MTITGHMEEKIPIPTGVKIDLKGNFINVSAKNIQLSRRLWHPKIKIETKVNNVVVSCELPNKREKALMGTFVAHIRNMIVGVTEGYKCEMRMVYSHFPIKLVVKEHELVIENFLGEKFPRRAPIVGETKIDVKGDQVIVTGHDKENVGQTAANIERATKIKNFDPRVFQDGIYIVLKPGEAH